LRSQGRIILMEPAPAPKAPSSTLVFIIGKSGLKICKRIICY
jgi:hypothetical protein